MLLYKKKSLVSYRTKTNCTTCNQLTILTVLANNQFFRRTRKVFLTQGLIDEIFVEIKMTPHSGKFRNSEPSDA